MKKRASKTAGYIASGLLVASTLLYSPKEARGWQIPLCNRLQTSSALSSDYFFVGISNTATDVFDLGTDLINPPPIGEGEEDFGDLSTLVDGYRLMSDIKGPIYPSPTKSWPIDLIVGSPGDSPVFGSNTIMADLLNFPDGYIIHLIDYGIDFSRISPIAIHDFRANPNYIFEVNDQFGPARALEVRVTIPEPSSLLGIVGGSIGALTYRQRRKAA